MTRRRIVFVYWICAIVLLPKAAYAYIDPATTTYLIQIATALIVMVGVSLSVFLYRFRTITTKIKYRLYGFIYGLRHKEVNKAGKDNEQDKDEKKDKKGLTGKKE